MDTTYVGKAFLWDVPVSGRTDIKGKNVLFSSIQGEHRFILTGFLCKQDRRCDYEYLVLSAGTTE